MISAFINIMLAEIMLWESDGNYLVNELLYVSKNFYNVILLCTKTTL